MTILQYSRGKTHYFARVFFRSCLKTHIQSRYITQMALLLIRKKNWQRKIFAPSFLIPNISPGLINHRLVIYKKNSRCMSVKRLCYAYFNIQKMYTFQNHPGSTVIRMQTDMSPVTITLQVANQLILASKITFNLYFV